MANAAFIAAALGGIAWIGFVSLAG